MAINMYAAITLLGLLSAALSSPLKHHPMHKRDLSEEIAAAETIVKVVTEGHIIELDCEASGSSPPVIHWMKDGQHVEQGPLDHFAENLFVPAPAEGNTEDYDHTSRSTLLIQNASPSDAGKYTCVADTQTERVSKAFDVQVTPSAEDRAQLNKRTLSNEVRIYLWSDTVFEEEDVDTRLICRATQGPNRPAPQIRWEINGETVDDNTEGMRLLRNGDLEFKSVPELHFALIKCVAIGDDGNQDFKEPWLYVYEN